MHKANKLLHESSPYLKQHAYNPVDWFPWGKEALEKAKREDKPILVSIGYSACHWCHVMERESFENQDLADMMNEYLICIKIDREERPDIDQIYMDAVQVMGINGGWPLNVFLTPELKPFYGGTYFPPKAWAQVVRGVGHAYREKKQEIEESAESFAQSLSRTDSEKYGLGKREAAINSQHYPQFFEKLKVNFDREMGGMNRAPKFPMPAIWQFVLQYYAISGNDEALQQLELTLDEMAKGGIYDQIGGGFARYSVDAEWFVPHFEKMLYDNGQLLSLYADAYRINPSSLYRNVLVDTIRWMKREMLAQNGCFYSALDADSEGEEGKFYVWTVDEWRDLFADDFERTASFYDIRKEGNWEHGKNILRKTFPDSLFMKKWNMDSTQFETWESQLKAKALAERDKRIRPGLDDKLLAGWNGLALKGLSDAYKAIPDKEVLLMATKLADFLEEHWKQEGQILRNLKEVSPKIPAFLEDYAAIIEGLIHLYQIEFEEGRLKFAAQLADYVLQEFFDLREGFFFFTPSVYKSELITRKKELFDNVIPASNSIMANSLWKLGNLLERQDFKDLAEAILKKISPMIAMEPQYLSNWASLYGSMMQPVAEVAIVGAEAKKMALELSKHYLPNILICASEGNSDLAIFEGRQAIGGKTTIYVCFDKTCKLPVFEIEKAIELIRAK